MKFIFLSMTYLFVGGFVFHPGQDHTGTLIIHIEGVRNTAGQIRVTLFKSKEGFPDNPDRSFKRMSVPIKNQDSITVEFQRIDFGEYAVAVLHDEDNDGKMKTGIFGIPLEGYAISNNAKGTFGPPSFEDAKFFLRSDSLAIRVKMNY